MSSEERSFGKQKRNLFCLMAMPWLFGDPYLLNSKRAMVSAAITKRNLSQLSLMFKVASASPK